MAKLPPLRRRSLYAVVLLLMVCTTYFGYIYFPRYAMHAMNRQQPSPSDFDKYLKEFESMPLYMAGSEKAPVTFKFSIAAALLEDTVLFIRRNGAPDVIYLGPYRDTIVVQAGNELTKGKGYDTLMIALLRKKTHEIYVTEQEARFWQANRTVKIEFLSQAVVDEATGEPAALKVSAE